MGKFTPDAIVRMMSFAKFELVYAFDPGDLTGVCRTVPEYIDTRLLTLSQEELFSYLSSQSNYSSVIFYEEFVSRPALFSRRQVAPEIIGAIKYWANIKSFRLIPVQPSQTHRIPRADVKAAGWKWNTEHEFDAIRILIYGMTLQHYRGEK